MKKVNVTVCLCISKDFTIYTDNYEEFAEPETLEQGGESGYNVSYEYPTLKEDVLEQVNLPDLDGWNIDAFDCYAD